MIFFVGEVASDEWLVASEEEKNNAKAQG